MKVLDERIRRLGSGRVVVRSDQEASILAHRDKVCDSAIIVTPSLVILKDFSSVGQSQQHGLAGGSSKRSESGFPLVAILLGGSSWHRHPERPSGACMVGSIRLIV